MLTILTVITAWRSSLSLCLSKKISLAGIFLLFFISLYLPPDLISFKKGLTGYIPWHTMMEMFAIIVSILAFIMEWENLNKKKYLNTAIVAVMFFSVAILDFFHMLSYPGLPDFITQSSANKSIYFWLWARLIVAVSMLYLALSKPRVLSSIWQKYLILILAIMVNFLILWGGLGFLEYFPLSYVEGRGLTQFKINAEAFICGILLVSLVILMKRAPVIKEIYDIENILMAIIIMILSEIFSN